MYLGLCFNVIVIDRCGMYVYATLSTASRYTPSTNLPRSPCYYRSSSIRLGARNSQDTLAAILWKWSPVTFSVGASSGELRFLIISRLSFWSPPFVSGSSSNYFHNSVILLFYGLLTMEYRNLGIAASWLSSLSEDGLRLGWILWLLDIYPNVMR